MAELFLLRRFLRRSGIALAVLVVIVTTIFDWVHRAASGMFRILLSAIGLTRIEERLRALPRVLAFLFIGGMLVLFVLFKQFEIGLLLDKRIVLALSLGFLFKIVWFGAMNYLLRVFSAQLLSVRAVEWTYVQYKKMRHWLHETLKAIPAYQRALQIKRKVLAFLVLARRRSLLNVARRWWQNKRHC